MPPPKATPIRYKGSELRQICSAGSELFKITAARDRLYRYVVGNSGVIQRTDVYHRIGLSDPRRITLVGKKTYHVANGVRLSPGESYSLYAILSDHSVYGYAFCRSSGFSFINIKKEPDNPGTWNFVFLLEQKPKK